MVKKHTLCECFFKESKDRKKKGGKISSKKINKNFTNNYFISLDEIYKFKNIKTF